MLGDGSATGGTAEDRFFGVTNPAGICYRDQNARQLGLGGGSSPVRRSNFGAGARVSDARARRMRCSVGNVRATMQMTGGADAALFWAPTATDPVRRQ